MRSTRQCSRRKPTVLRMLWPGSRAISCSPTRDWSCSTSSRSGAILGLKVDVARYADWWQSEFAHHLHRRPLAKRVQLVEGAMAALDHPWNDMVAPVTDGDLEHVEDVCRCEHRRPLPADQDENSRPQLLSDTVQQRILEG